MWSHHPLVTCTKVMALALPVWCLYKKFLENHTPQPLKHAAFGLIYFSSTLGILKLSNIKITPLTTLALSLTYLSWIIFLRTNLGRELVTPF